MTVALNEASLPRVNILGVGVHAVDMLRAIHLIDSALSQGKRGYVCVTGVHGIMEAQKDTDFEAILNHSLLTTPDGMPTVWIGRLKGFSQMRQVTGPNFMLRVCELSVAKGYTHFFYGGVEGVADQLKSELTRRFPGLNVVGTYTPPFRPLSVAEECELTSQVARLKPDLFWIGLSTPKQERFMAQFLPLLPEAKVFLGVGAAFDFLTGRVKQAPRWMMRSGLEWFFRLSQEPKRLWRRYAVYNPLFVWRAAGQLLGWRNYHLRPGPGSTTI